MKYTKPTNQPKRMSSLAYGQDKSLKTPPVINNMYKIYFNLSIIN